MSLDHIEREIEGVEDYARARIHGLQEKTEQLDQDLCDVRQEIREEVAQLNAEIANLRALLPAGQAVPKPTQKPDCWYGPNLVVTLAGGTACPHCRESLRACGVSQYGGVTELACLACHEVVLSIEPHRQVTP